MAMDGKLLAKARQVIDSIRIENEAEHIRRERSVYNRVPEIEQIDRTMRRQMTKLMRLTISDAQDVEKQIEVLKNQNLDLQIRKSELLVSNGYPIDYLNEIHSCSKCKDTGFVNGNPCSCLTEQYNHEMTKELATLLKSGDESFDRFNFAYYDNKPNEAGVSPRKQMQLIYDFAVKYANEFTPQSSNLLLYGSTGLGKTFLSGCIANVVANKYSVCYDTAASALTAFEQQKFARDLEDQQAASTKVERMLSCDLMILDDLGTEMVTQLSISALYTLINTRLVNHKATILSTNLSDDEIYSKYSKQIASRIDGEFLKLVFAGSDIRKIKKEMES